MKKHSLLLLLLSFVQVFPLFWGTPYKEGTPGYLFPGNAGKSLSLATRT